MNTHTMDKIYLSFDETTPLEKIEAALPESELQQLDAIGDSRDDDRWTAGNMARLWIDDRKLPQAQCLSIVAKRTDWGVQSIRKFLYCSRYYHEHADLYDKYNILRHSIFDHARNCSDPETVLREAMEKRLTPTQAKENHPALMDELKDLMTRIPKRYEQQAREILMLALGKLKELMEAE